MHCLHPTIKMSSNLGAGERFLSVNPGVGQRFLSLKHRLPINSRIQYRIALTRFNIVSGTAPPYLSELLRLYSPSRSLRSASYTRIFRVPRVYKVTMKFCFSNLRRFGSFNFTFLSEVDVFFSPPNSFKYKVLSETQNYPIFSL